MDQAKKRGLGIKILANRLQEKTVDQAEKLGTKIVFPTNLVQN